MADGGREGHATDATVRFVDEDLPWGKEPCGLLVRKTSAASVEYGWRRDGRGLLRVEGLESGQPTSRNVLAAGGTSVVFERTFLDPDESLPWTERNRTLGVYHLDLRDGHVDRLAYEVPWGASRNLAFAPAADGGRVAVATQVMRAEPDKPLTGRDAWLSLTVVGARGPEVELLHIRGGVGPGGDDLPVQWSPDGSLIAVNLVDLTVGVTNRLAVIDAAAGTEVTSLPGARLVGSASWTPDSRRLLFVDRSEVVRLASLDAPHARRVPLPGPRSSGDRTWDVLGMADDHHVLTVHRDGESISVAKVNVDTGRREVVVSWTAPGPGMYVITAPMPAGFWD